MEYVEIQYKPFYNIIDDPMSRVAEFCRYGGSDHWRKSEEIESDRGEQMEKIGSGFGEKNFLDLDMFTYKET